MNAIFANPVTLTIVPPLAAGVLLGLLAWVAAGNRLAMAIGWSLGALFVYWLLEGVPPLPPIAAKQKLGYVFALGGVGALIAAFFPLARLVLIVLAAVAVVWLGWSKLGDPANAETVMLAALAALWSITVTLVWQRVAQGDGTEVRAENAFLVPAALLTMAIGGSVIAGSGLFLGMAQMLGALAALIGGGLIVSFLALLLRGRGVALLPEGADVAVDTAILSGLVMTTVLAPSVSQGALLMLTLGATLVAVLGARRLPAVLPAAPVLRPLLAGAIIALPAIAASLFAVLSGTSPFA